MGGLLIARSELFCRGKINWTAMITNLSMQRVTLLITNTQGLPENAVYISFKE
jgi:hypothetical protein